MFNECYAIPTSLFPTHLAPNCMDINGVVKRSTIQTQLRLTQLVTYYSSRSPTLYSHPLNPMSNSSRPYRVGTNPTLKLLRNIFKRHILSILTILHWNWATSISLHLFLLAPTVSLTSLNILDRSENKNWFVILPKPVKPPILALW